MADDNFNDDNWYSDQAATFGDRVAGARELAGMDQQDLARNLGVKLKTLRAWEDDLAEPRANKLQMPSGVLNVSLTWLLNGQGDGIGGPDEPLILDNGIRDTLQEIRTLKTQMSQAVDRLGQLEMTLRHRLQEGSE